MDLCAHELRGGDLCLLDAGHRGQHRHYGVWCCDGCGRQRHGPPAATGNPDDGSEGMAFCFLCAGEPARRQADRERFGEAHEDPHYTGERLER